MSEPIIERVVDPRTGEVHVIVDGVCERCQIPPPAEAEVEPPN